jgi:hypothetical protein
MAFSLLETKKIVANIAERPRKIIDRGSIRLKKIFGRLQDADLQGSK